jgi:hypothetical protein
MYKYHLSNGGIIISPSNLNYALGADNCINREEITENDAMQASIIVDPSLALICQIAMDSSKWQMPEYAMQHRTETDVSFLQHCAVMQDGNVFIDNGGYVPLNDIITKSNQDEKNIILKCVAYQAALAQLSMAQLAASNTEV